MIFRIGEWAPDLPALENPGALEALNVVPRTNLSYGPWRLPVTVSTNALDSRAQGAVSGAGYDNAILTFAGDAGKLYNYSGSTFTDVSKVGGYATAPNYADNTSRAWQFEQYKNTIIASNFSDAIQSWALGSSVLFADLASSAPKGKYVANVGEFLVVANTNDVFDGDVSLRLWWSPIGNPAQDDWGNTNLQSDFRTLTSGEQITGIAGGEFGVIFCLSAIYRMTYSGPPPIFTIDEVVTGRAGEGCIAPGSLAQTTEGIFYLSNDGFRMFQGFQSVAIGQDRVDDFFFKDLDRSNIGRVVSIIDGVRKLYIVAYPGTGSTSGQPNKLLIYNFQLNRWSRAEQQIETLITLRSESLTVEALGAIFTLTDDVPGLTDSPQWSGGTDFLACFDPTHSLCSFTGVNAAATVDTSEQAINGAGKTLLRAVEPLTDSDNVTVSIGSRDTQNVAPTFSAAIAPEASTNLSKFKIKARYHRARIETPEGWLGNEIFGVDGVNVRKLGNR